MISDLENMFAWPNEDNPQRCKVLKHFKFDQKVEPSECVKCKTCEAKGEQESDVVAYNL